MIKYQIFGIIAIILLTSQISLAGNKKKIPPNILLFIADDCTYRDIGCYGSVDSQTPNIDSFAKEGMQFTRCFQAASMCSPTQLSGLFVTNYYWQMMVVVLVAVFVPIWATVLN